MWEAREGPGEGVGGGGGKRGTGGDGAAQPGIDPRPPPPQGEGGERGRGPSGIVTSVLARDTDAARPAIVTSGPVDTGDLIQCSTVTRAVRALYGSLQDTLCCRRRVTAH